MGRTFLFSIATLIGTATVFGQEPVFFTINADTDEFVRGTYSIDPISVVGQLGIDVAQVDMTLADEMVFAIDSDPTEQQVALLQIDQTTGAAFELALLFEGSIPVIHADALAADSNGDLIISYTTDLDNETSNIGTVDLTGQVTFLFDASVKIDAMATDVAGNTFGVNSTMDNQSGLVTNDFFLMFPFQFIGTQQSDFAIIEDMFFRPSGFLTGISTQTLAELDIHDLQGFEPEGMFLNPPGNYQGLILGEFDLPDVDLEWEIGDIAPDFVATRITSSGNPEMVAWHSESEQAPDYFVISTCAMWCAPCQLFALESQTIVDALAEQNVTIEIYDWIFQNPAGSEPDAQDAQFWIADLWTADPQNVWYGGDLTADQGGVIENIFLSNDTNAIPNILVMNSSFEILAQYSGFQLEPLIELIAGLEPRLGDVNQDGNVDLLDIAPFINVLSSGQYQIEADCNQDDRVDLLDIDPFILIVGG